MNIERSSDTIKNTVRSLHERLLPGSGFAERPGSAYRTDATAWAIIALAGSSSADIIGNARSCLAASQLDDGRVGISAEHPQTIWPTSLAALAWHGSAPHREPQSRAIRFLLQTEGRRWGKKPDDPLRHDTTIRGWPWIENTFSWIEPTALAVLALRITGNSGHPRVREALRMVMDRQLPHGGWNYGNTVVYGQELYPQIESTGLALAALAGEIEKTAVKRSLHYLKTQAERCRTPLSLGWALLGLGAWQERPRHARAWIMESLKRQQRYGVYGTTLLSLLMLAYRWDGDITAFIARGKDRDEPAKI